MIQLIWKSKIPNYDFHLIANNHIYDVLLLINIYTYISTIIIDEKNYLETKNLFVSSKTSYKIIYRFK